MVATLCAFAGMNVSLVSGQRLPGEVLEREYWIKLLFYNKTSRPLADV